ncbi:MAG: SDR family oxidoreductase [Dehalococcoidia bacterium]|nr:SDR family oxidoreductase [Dehalococcoidia bacterium]
MRALVTGGAGFIGSRVVRALLDAGREVVVLDDLSSGFRENMKGLPAARLIEADVRDREAVDSACEGAEVVFHLAASVGNKRSIDDPRADASVNLLGTLNVLEAARRGGVRKVVLSSSVGVLGEVERLPVTEEHPTRPISPYGVSKLAAEKMALVYHELHGVEVACLRYFNVYGPGQRSDAYGSVLPIFVFRMLAGESLTVFDDGEQTRDFVYVDDVARANLLAAEPGAPSGVFNVASGKAISLNRLVGLLREASGLDARVTHEAPRPGDVRDSLADTAKARRELGFEAAVSIEEGIARYFDWARREAAQAATR